MGLLYDARVRAIDANGAPMSGATLTLYTANTVTPAAIFADAALSVPLSNPTLGADAADAGGWFPQIFAADGTVVDILLKDSGGSTIKSYVDVAIGSDSAQLERTLADDTRFVVRGAGGVVYMEFGNPDPDDIGGTAVIGGWDGTEADLITINAALFDTTGRIKEIGKKLTGTVHTDATAFTAVTSLDVLLPNNPTGIRAWDLLIWDFRLSGNANLGARFSYDGGATYVNTAAAYAWLRLDGGSTDGAGAGSSLSATWIQLVSNLNGAANKHGRLALRIFGPDSGNDCATIDWTMSGVSTTQHYLGQGMGYGPASSGRPTNVRILADANTMTGMYRLAPVRGTGDA